MSRAPKPPQNSRQKGQTEQQAKVHAKTQADAVDTGIRADPKFRDSVTTNDDHAGGALSGKWGALALRDGTVGPAQRVARSLTQADFPFVTGYGVVLPSDVLLRAFNFPQDAGKRYLPSDVLLRGANHPDGSVPAAALIGVPGHNHAAGNVTSGVFADARIPGLAAGKIDSGVFGIERIPDIGWGKVTGKPLGGPQSDYALRQISGSGNAGSAAASNHTHSISAKHVSAEARRILLSLREKARAASKNTGAVVTRSEFRDLCGMVLGLCHLALDDEDTTAEEREKRLASDPEYRKHFEESELWHENAETGEAERRNGKFNTGMHADLLAFASADVLASVSKKP